MTWDNDVYKKLEDCVWEDLVAWQGAGDYMSLEDVVYHCRRLTDQDPMNYCLELIENLREGKSIDVGYPSPDGKSFVAYTHGTSEILKDVERKWKELGRDPIIGEIIWLNLRN